MKFMLRFVIVLSVAVGLGFALYYAVQALPNDGPGLSQGNQRPDNPELRPEEARPERGERRDGGLSLRGFVGVAGKTMMFSVITLITVMVTMVFKRKPARIQPPTG